MINLVRGSIRVQAINLQVEDRERCLRFFSCSAPRTASSASEFGQLRMGILLYPDRCPVAEAIRRSCKFEGSFEIHLEKLEILLKNTRNSTYERLSRGLVCEYHS